MTRVFRGMVAAGCLALLSGCIAQRSISTLPPSPDAAGALKGLQFRVAAVEGNNPVGASVDNLQQGLVATYPGLFTDDLTAIPVVVRVAGETDQQIIGAILTGLTLGIVPLPAHTGHRMEVGVTPWSINGATAPESVVRYKRTDHGWMTIFTPLGLIPMPGRSDIPRMSGIAMDEAGMTSYAATQTAFSMRELQRAVVVALSRDDPGALRQAWAARQALPSVSVDIDGRHYDGHLVPAFSQGLRQPGGADQYLLVLKTVETRGGTVTRTITYSLPVARRDATGAWQVLRPYLTFSSRPMVATTLLEGGTPSRALVLPENNPPLTDFIDPPVAADQTAAGPVRWSNGILLQIKNSSLAGELHSQSLQDLQQLTTRLEAAMLDLNERSTRANDRAQQAIEKGESPDAQREMATLYRQRLEILKNITGTVRQEAASRGAGSMTP